MISIFFCSLQNALNDKNFLKYQVKIFVENFFSSKPAEFYSRGINKQPNKWQKAIQSNGKHKLKFIKLFMNKLYFTKNGNYDSQPNTKLLKDSWKVLYFSKIKSWH